MLYFVDMRRWKDAWAEHVKDATLEAIAHACRLDNNEIDYALVEKVLRSIEIYNADAAKDEQYAGRLLQGKKLDDVSYTRAWMPSLVMLHRDKPHAARRLTQRGWNADPFLKQVPGESMGLGSDGWRISSGWKGEWMDII